MKTKYTSKSPRMEVFTKPPVCGQEQYRWVTLRMRLSSIRRQVASSLPLPPTLHVVVSRSQGAVLWIERRRGHPQAGRTMLTAASLLPA
jgi:hypothetical protein